MRRLVVPALAVVFFSGRLPAQTRYHEVDLLRFGTSVVRVRASSERLVEFIVTGPRGTSGLTMDPDSLAPWLDSTARVMAATPKTSMRDEVVLDGPEIEDAELHRGGMRLTRRVGGRDPQSSLEIFAATGDRASLLVTRSIFAQLQKSLKEASVEARHLGASAAAPVTADSSHEAPPDASQPYFEFQVEKPAVQAPGSAQPIYPPELRGGRMAGTVLAQFIVDTTGHVEVGTFKVLSTTDEKFSDAVRDALPRMVFIPAELDSHRVKQLVQQPFVFTAPR